MTDDVIHEVFAQFPAYASIFAHISRCDALTIDPHDAYSKLCAADHDRLAALVFAHCHADSIPGAEQLIRELFVMLRDGRRPRCGVEAGLTWEMFER